MKKWNCILLFIMLLVFNVNASFNLSDLTWASDVGAKNRPTATKQFKVSAYGAKADGISLNTEAIQKAIDECARQGGGIVTFEKGDYLTGSIYLKDEVNLHIPKGTRLLGSQRIEDYPEMDTRVAGIEMRWPSALINVLNAKNVLISGQGIVHAQGKIFWDKYWTMRKEYEKKQLRWIIDYDCTRPRTLLISKSSDITVEGITFQQAGFWTIQLLYSSYCTVNGVTIQNNLGGHGPSTDGVDIDSSSHILVENCDIDCNDDNFCLKAGRDADGLRVNRPTEYIVIRNCISRAGGGLLTCGSETSGGIRYVLAHGLKAKGTSVGIRLKSAMNRGGTTEHIYIKDVEMDQVRTAFEATMNWNPSYSYSVLPKEFEGKAIPEHWKKMLEPVNTNAGTPYFRDVYLSDLKITNAKQLMVISGSKQSMMTDFHISNIEAQVDQIGSIEYAQNWKLDNIQLNVKDNLPIKIKNSQNIDFKDNKRIAEGKFPYTINNKSDGSKVLASAHPEFAFLFPEMAGNLKFGIIANNQSKWLSDFSVQNIKQLGNQLIYTFGDSCTNTGNLILKALPLSNTQGIIVEVSGENIPENTNLFWSFGGAFGKTLTQNESGVLQPIYCKDNVFSVEHTAFTLYYGESMKLKVVNAVTPPCSEIRLSDAFVQNSPLEFFNSGKKTDAPALTGTLALKKGDKKYFCVYKQNSKADYNHFMLAELFDQELKSYEKQ